MHGVQQLRVGRGERGKAAGRVEPPRVRIEVMSNGGWRSHPFAVRKERAGEAESMRLKRRAPQLAE